MSKDNLKTVSMVSALFGLIFFVIVKNKLKKKLDELVENEKKDKSDNFD